MGRRSCCERPDDVCQTTIRRHVLPVAEITDSVTGNEDTAWEHQYPGLFFMDWIGRYPLARLGDAYTMNGLRFECRDSLLQSWMDNIGPTIGVPGGPNIRDETQNNQTQDQYYNYYRYDPIAYRFRHHPVDLQTYPWFRQARIPWLPGSTHTARVTPSERLSQINPTSSYVSSTYRAAMMGDGLAPLSHIEPMELKAAQQIIVPMPFNNGYLNPLDTSNIEGTSGGYRFPIASDYGVYLTHIRPVINNQVAGPMIAVRPELAHKEKAAGREARAIGGGSVLATWSVYGLYLGGAVYADGKASDDGYRNVYDKSGRLMNQSFILELFDDIVVGKGEIVGFDIWIRIVRENNWYGRVDWSGYTQRKVWVTTPGGQPTGFSETKPLLTVAEVSALIDQLPDKFVPIRWRYTLDATNPQVADYLARGFLPRPGFPMHSNYVGSAGGDWYAEDPEWPGYYVTYREWWTMQITPDYPQGITPANVFGTMTNSGRTWDHTRVPLDTYPQQYASLLRGEWPLNITTTPYPVRPRGYGAFGTPGYGAPGRDMPVDGLTQDIGTYATWIGGDASHNYNSRRQTYELDFGPNFRNVWTPPLMDPDIGVVKLKANSELGMSVSNDECHVVAGFGGSLLNAQRSDRRPLKSRDINIRLDPSYEFGIDWRGETASLIFSWNPYSYEVQKDVVVNPITPTTYAHLPLSHPLRAETPEQGSIVIVEAGYYPAPTVDSSWDYLQPAIVEEAGLSLTHSVGAFDQAGTTVFKLAYVKFRVNMMPADTVDWGAGNSWSQAIDNYIYVAPFNHLDGWNSYLLRSTRFQTFSQNVNSVTRGDGPYANIADTIIATRVDQIDLGTFSGTVSKMTTDEDTDTGGPLFFTHSQYFHRAYARPQSLMVEPPNLRIESGDEPTNGTAAIDIFDPDFPGKGAWTYSPDADFNGTDDFVISVTNNNNEVQTQTITITVDQINDPGTFGGDTSATTNANTDTGGTLTFTDAADGFTTPNFRIESGDEPDNGTATINDTGDWTYSPDTDFNGPDSFTVSVTDDDENVETQAIAITVN